MFYEPYRLNVISVGDVSPRFMYEVIGAVSIDSGGSRL